MLINAMSIMQAIAAIVSISSGVKLKKKNISHMMHQFYIKTFLDCDSVDYLMPLFASN